MDHSCEVCGRGSFNDSDDECVCRPDLTEPIEEMPRHSVTKQLRRELETALRERDTAREAADEQTVEATKARKRFDGSQEELAAVKQQLADEARHREVFCRNFNEAETKLKRLEKLDRLTEISEELPGGYQ